MAFEESLLHITMLGRALTAYAGDQALMPGSPPAAVPRKCTSPRVRVLQVHNYYQQSGGEDSVVANEKALLASHGHEVFQYSVHNDAISTLKSKVETFLDIGYSQKARDAFARELAVIQPDVVHVHNFFPLLTTSIYDACEDAGIPVVQTLHNFRIMCAGVYLMRDGKVCDTCVGGNPYWGVVYRCYRGSVAGSLAVARMIETNQRRGTWRSKVDCFIVLTESSKELFVRAGVPADLITVKPNFAADPGEVPAENRHGALYVGRLSTEKGVREMIRAWQKIDYPLRIAGDGPLSDELRAIAPKNVTFLGRISAEQVQAEMKSAAMLVAFSTWLEGFPVVLAEALAVGLPAIVSDIGAPKDIVRHGDTGLHVSMGDSDALADAINDLARDDVNLARMSRASRLDYLAHYSEAVNYVQLASIYERALVARGIAVSGNGQTPIDAT